jgi:hypothetical protein
MQRPLKTGLAIVAAASLFAIGGVSSATAAKLITGTDIKNGSLTGADVKNGSLGFRDLGPYARKLVLDDKGATGATGAKGDKGEAGANGKDGVNGEAGANGKDGANGATGAKGDKGEAGVNGKDGLTGAVYWVANYKNGGAGDVTVACADTNEESMKYTAIAGGIQAGGVQSMGQTSEFDVAGSFPGRMNWETGTPKADRLDGWIVLGSGGWSDTLKVWALCVPNTDIPVEVTDIDN